MDLIPCPAAAAPERCDDRTRRLVRVKFVALSIEPVAAVQARARFARIRKLIFRVIGCLVAARP